MLISGDIYNKVKIHFHPLGATCSRDPTITGHDTGSQLKITPAIWD